MMKKIVLALVITATLCLAAQPARAQCTASQQQCPGSAVCVDVGVNGVDAAGLAACIESNWNLPNYACLASPTQQGAVQVAASNGVRTITYEVPAGTVQNSFTYVLRFATPLGESGALPFDMFVDYDNQGEIMIRDGLTSFPEINMLVVTGEPPTLPAIGTTRAVWFVAGLLAVGVAILLRRSV